MSKRMDIIEKIAREICWAEFATKPKGVTKAAYWGDISPKARTELMREARRFVWAFHKIPVNLLNETVAP